MAGGRHGLWPRIVALVVATAAAAGGAWFGAPLAASALVVPPPVWREGSAPAPVPSVLEAATDQAPIPTSAGLKAALNPLMSAAALGGHTAVSVVDVATGQQLFTSGDRASTPASTTKIVTAAAVLAARGPTYQLRTRAVAGQTPGEVVLIGGGDPTLTAGANGTYPGAARLDDLAGQVRASLGETAPTRVVYDTSLFTGALFGPGWDADIPTGGFAAAVTPLMLNGGRINPKQTKGAAQRYDKPELAAAQAFAKVLGLPSSAVSAGAAPAGASELGHVDSPPLARLVEVMLSESDNVLAEVLARHVAIARGQPATFDGAATAMKAALGELGIPTEGYGLVDGSGLSRNDRLTATLLTLVLAAAARADQAQLHAVFSGLPTAGYSGTLRDRYITATAGASAAGNARAKTGTLTGVSSVAGIVVDADGRTLAFAVISDAVTKGSVAAEASLDRLVAVLAGCGCR
ncbi:MAG: D-alanyl-D-alanine carboxypeptidase/D-alanyl-D-alanine-endopeptidase [Micromonosporaceae bacterium]|nr:D-alanyl-D-alanine carboxypeptidase/D-alanyl-D-alanine-endopeptidase [Micromonosporaceae bacterium]